MQVTCVGYINLGHHTSSKTDRLEILLWRTKASGHTIVLSQENHRSIKRITRIVSQNLQKAKQLTAMTSTSKTAMSQTIVGNRMRCAKKSSEERKPAKFSQAACLKENTCSSGTDANADLPGEATPHRLSENRTNLRKSAPGWDCGHRKRPTWRTRRCVGRLWKWRAK